MSEITSYTTGNYDNGRRLEQLQNSLTSADVGELRRYDNKIAAYLELGEHWSAHGLFQISQELSKDAWREVLLTMPEAYLAMLVHETNDVDKLKQDIDTKLSSDNKALAKALLDRGIAACKAHSDGGRRMQVLDESDRNTLDEETDDDSFMNVLQPAPTSQLPPWFAVIEACQLGPLDLKLLRESFIAGTWKGAQPGAVDTNDVRLKIHERIGE